MTAAIAAAVLVAVPVRPRPAEAGVLAAPGVGIAHPRILFVPGDEAMLQDRLTREPYRTVFTTMHARATSWNTRPLGDTSLTTHRDLSRAAKVFAFEYALDRTVIGGQIVPFPDAAAREVQGDRVRDLLLNLFPRSRLAVPAPIGGWDRDISTAEEITNYVTAFDTMLGGGYDFAGDRAAIVGLLTSVTDELYQNFVDPSTAGNFTTLHQNNHRSKSGAAIATAAIVLADDVPQARAWFDYGVLEVDDVLQYMLMAGDGAYAEGPFYYRLTTQNLLPLLSAWERVLGDSSWTVGGVEVPAMQTHPLFRRTQRWMIDSTLPDGTMAPIDDGNPGRSYYFGALPAELPDTAAAYGRWASTPQPYETDGSVELGPDTIVAYDDSITPSAPWWSPTSFYVEGGTASLRSDWSSDAIMAVVLGEHDTASEFGRDRLGVGRAPQSHEHADGGSFMLNAFGQRLALDPGYLTFTTHGLVNKPQDHNMVLVDGAGPPDYLQASLAWLSNPLGRPPAEGQSTIHRTLDAGGLDATSVATWYRQTEVDRRFLLADDRYLVVGDAIEGAGGALTWMQHGNGGGTSGGTYAATPVGGRWEIGGARLDSAIAVADQAVALDAVDTVHEVPFTQQRTHTARRATVGTGSADAVQVFYPTLVGAAAPTITTLDAPGEAGLEVVDAAEDRRVTIRNGAEVDDLAVVDEHLDGSLRLAYAEGATVLAHGGEPLVVADAPGTLGLRLPGDGTAEVVAQTADLTIELGDLGFTPATVDGACSFETVGGVTRVRLGRERRITLREAGTDAQPAADPGPFQRVTPGSTVALDGSASCDADGDALTYQWELVSAPAGSAWSLTGADGAQPELLADRAGPYRVRLVVTDEHGMASAEQEVLVVAGDRCADGIDNDTDGRIDTDDGDCDGVDEAEPPPPDAEIELSGVVTSTSGAPVAGASVWAYDADDRWIGSGWTTTGADGSFTFDHLPPGEYRLVFRAPAGTGLVSEWFDDSPSRADAAPLIVEPGDEVVGLDAELALGAAVEGVVTDENGQPLAGVQVWAYDSNDKWLGSAMAVTADDGSYLLEGLDTTSYRVRFVAAASAGRRAEWFDDATTRAAATWVEAMAGQLRSGVDGALSPTG